MHVLLPETLLPKIIGERRADACVELDLHIQPEIAHFPGHFPDFPVLPGIVQIDWAIRLARQYFTLGGVFTALENIKFQALVLPEANLTLTLTWDATKAGLQFAYASAVKKHSTGRIVFGSNCDNKPDNIRGGNI